MTTISLRFDDEMKKQLDEMCDEMGMNLTYSDSNMEQLKKANQQIKNGQVIVKTIEELEAMEFE